MAKDKKKGAKSVPFYTRQQVKGQTWYRDPKGRRVSEAKAKRSKRKIVHISKGKKLIPSGVKPERVEAFHKGEVFSTQIFGQSVARSITDHTYEGSRIGLKYKGEILDIGEGNSFDAVSFFNELESAYIKNFNAFTDSPQMQVGYIEGNDAVLLDLDTMQVMDDELAEEFEEDEDFQHARRSFAASKGALYKKYFK